MVTLRSIFGVVLCFILVSCNGTYIEPYLMYRAKFDPVNVDEAESLIIEIAQKWNLEIERTSREENKYLTSDRQEAFYLFGIYNDKVIMTSGNVGSGTSVDIMFFDKMGFPIKDLDSLAVEVKTNLEKSFGLEFCLVDAPKSKCKEVPPL